MSKPELNDRWKDVLADTEATAEEYRERDWEAIDVTPGDVNPVADAARLDVLLPGSQFDAVHDRMADVDIGGFRVYAACEDGVNYRLVVAEDADDEFALCIPTFLRDADVDDLREGVAAAGRLTIRLRPLDDRDVVDVTLADPELYFESEPSA